MKLPLVVLAVAFLAMPTLQAQEPGADDAIVLTSEGHPGLLGEPTEPTPTQELFAATDQHAAFTVDTCGGYFTGPTETVWYATWGDDGAPDWWVAMQESSQSRSALTKDDSLAGIVKLDLEALVGEAGYSQCCACRVGAFKACVVWTRDGGPCCCKAEMEGIRYWDWQCACSSGECQTSPS